MISHPFSGSDGKFGGFSMFVTHIQTSGKMLGLAAGLAVLAFPLAASAQMAGGGMRGGATSGGSAQAPAPPPAQAPASRTVERRWSPDSHGQGAEHGGYRTPARFNDHHGDGARGPRVDQRADNHNDYRGSNHGEGGRMDGRYDRGDGHGRGGWGYRGGDRFAGDHRGGYGHGGNGYGYGYAGRGYGERGYGGMGRVADVRGFGGYGGFGGRGWAYGGLGGMYVAPVALGYRGWGYGGLAVFAPQIIIAAPTYRGWGYDAGRGAPRGGYASSHGGNQRNGPQH